MAKKKQKPYKLQAPDVNYLLALYNELTSNQEFQKQDTQIDDFRAMRELTYTVSVPEEVHFTDLVVRDATIADEAFRVQSMFALHRPKLKVHALETSKKATENATLREHFTEEALWEAGRHNPGMHAWGAATDAVYNDGGACLKLVFAPDLWEERYALRRKDFTNDLDYDKATEKAKHTSVPFKLLAPDVRTVYPIPNANKPEEVLEVTEVPISSTFRRYRLKRDDKGNIVPDELGQGVPEHSYAGTNTLLRLELWDDRWVTYAFVGTNNASEGTGAIVDQWEHGYGRVPHEFAPGMMMSHWRNRKVGWAIGQTKVDAVKHYSLLMTALGNLAFRDIAPPIMRRSMPEAPMAGDDGTGKEDEQRWKLGVIYDEQPGRELVPLQFPNVAQSFIAHAGDIQKQIQTTLTPNMPSEIGAGEASGFKVAQELSEVRIRLDQPAQHLQDAMERLTYFFWHLIRTKVRERVWVARQGKDSGWYSATPEDLADTVGVRWEIDPERPTAKLIESRYHAEQVKSGFEGRSQAIEAQGGNPDEAWESIALDEMMADPRYKEWLKTQTFIEGGRGDLLKTQEAEKVAQGGALPGMPATPPAMGNGEVPDLGALAASPNGEGMGGPPMQGSVPGASPGVVVPQQGAMAGMVRQP